MFLLHPVSYEGTVSGILSGECDALLDSVLDVRIPGMLSIASVRLVMACKDLPLRAELSLRELRQRFSAGDYFSLGHPSSICVITVGVDRNPEKLTPFIVFLQSLTEDIVCLSDFDEDPEMEVFFDVLSESVNVKKMTLEEIRNYAQSIDCVI